MSKLALLALAFVLTSGAARAAQPPTACLIVYGHGRNVGEVPQNQAWDRINARFNALVTARLRAAGLQAEPLLFKVGETDVQTAIQILTTRAEAQGCSRVVDTAVFADDNGALIVRLRVHPLLGRFGPVAKPGPTRIGTPLYTGQSEFDLNARTLEHLKLEAMADSMVADYLKQSAAAASPSQ